jgi:hypothetical protein
MILRFRRSKLNDLLKSNRTRQLTQRIKINRIWYPWIRIITLILYNNDSSTGCLLFELRKQCCFVFNKMKRVGHQNSIQRINGKIARDKVSGEFLNADFINLIRNLAQRPCIVAYLLPQLS